LCQFLETTNQMKFFDRQDAGNFLAKELSKYKNAAKTIVLGLPRGGVITALAVAKRLSLPLDIIVVRKISALDNPEFAIGATDENGKAIFNEEAISYFQVPKTYLSFQLAKEKMEARRRLKLYRKKRKKLDLNDKTVILVDDGIATGFTMRAAIESVKAKGAKKVIIAVPVAPSSSVLGFEKEVDDLVMPYTTDDFLAVGQFYQSFEQTTDQEVIDALNQTSVSP